MTQQVRVGVGVIVNRGGKILMGQRKGSHGTGHYSVPGGHLDFGETPEECAVREVLEETGLTLSHCEWMHQVTNDVFVEEGKHYITLWVFCRLSEADQQIPKLLEPEKCNGWGWYDWNDLPSPLFLPMSKFVEQNPYFSTVLALNLHPGIDHVQSPR